MDPLNNGMPVLQFYCLQRWKTDGVSDIYSMTALGIAAEILFAKKRLQRKARPAGNALKYCPAQRYVNFMQES